MFIELGTISPSPLIAALPNPISHVLSFGADSALQAVSQWVATGAAWLLDQAGRVMSLTTRPDLGATWFHSHYAVMVGLAALVVLPLLLVSVLQSIARQDMSGLLRVALVQLPLAMLLTVVAVTIVETAVSAVDAMSQAVASSSGLDTRNLLSGVAQALGGEAFLTGSPGIPLFVTFLTGLVVAMGAFALWLELVVRTAAIYVAVLFLPLSLTGLVWPATARWPRRLAETLGALILAKLVVVGILSLAASALSGEGGPTNLAGVVGGAALLLLAAFAPYALLRVIPMVEAGAVAHLEGTGRRGMRPLASAASSLGGLLAGAGGGDAGFEIPMAAGTPEPAGMGSILQGGGWRDVSGDDDPGGGGERPGRAPSRPGGPGGISPGATSERTEVGSSGLTGLGTGEAGSPGAERGLGPGADRAAGAPAGALPGAGPPGSGSSDEALGSRLMGAWLRSAGSSSDGPLGPPPGGRSLPGGGEGDADPG